MSLTLFIILMAFFFTSLSSADIPCQDLMKKLADVYKVQEGRSSYSNSKGKYFELGEGVGGGIVYRVFPFDHLSPFIEKEYNEQGSLENDVAGLRFIQAALLSFQRQKQISAAKILDVKERSLTMQDVRGETVYNLAKGSPRDQNRLSYVFFKQLEILKEAMETAVATGLAPYSELNLQINDKGIPYLKGTYKIPSGKDPQKVYHIWVHGKNVILTPEGNLVVIDPN